MTTFYKSRTADVEQNISAKYYFSRLNSERAVRVKKPEMTETVFANVKDHLCKY